MRPRLAVLAFVLLAGAGPALAQSNEGEDSEAKRLAAAIAACDQGAAAPLDPDATEPPVQFGELFPPDFNLPPLRALADACRFASERRYEVPRLWLQWLRTEISLGERYQPYMAERVRKLAAGGSAEADYLLFAIYRLHDGGGVDRAEAEAGLRRAAEAGHREALETVVDQLRFGPHLRRDPHEAARFAALWAELPSQGIGFPTAFDRESMEEGVLIGAGLPLVADGFGADEQARAFVVMRDLYEKNVPAAFVPYISALRYGRGTDADPERARAILETAVAADNARALVELAEMLAEGEGGPADGRRALALLTDPLAEQAAYAARPALAGLYLDNRYTGPRPRAAIRLLATSGDVDAVIRAAPLLADYDERVPNAEGYASLLASAAEVGEPGAAMAWIGLQLSRHPDFGDVDGARDVLARLAAEGDAEAPVMLAETQFIDLDSGRFDPPRRRGAMSDVEVRTLLDKAAADGQASAFRAKAKLMRAGAVYPQDDAGATAMLAEAATRGDVEAMVLLGEAYDDGKGIAEDARERTRWWREAARLGSLAATENLVDAFTFDSFDKLLTLREGITERVALYNNGPVPDALSGPFATSRFAGLFVGGRAMEAGMGPLIAAFMDGYRQAPTGLGDGFLVPLMQALPDEAKVAIESALAEQGFYAGKPEGYFGPEVRAALAAWVDARGPLPDAEEAPPASGGEAGAGPVLPDDLVARIRDRVFAEANAGNLSPEEQVRILGELNTLAQYGDLSARWAVLTFYHQAALVQRQIGVGDVTRYGLDLVVTRPPDAEKVDFEFIFAVSKVYELGRSDEFGQAFIDAVRDDPRLRDPLTLGGVAEQVLFAPGGCDGIRAAARAAGVAGLGEDGCDEASRAAIIAFATEKGPAGVDAAIRAAAAETLRGMDVAER